MSLKDIRKLFYCGVIVLLVALVLNSMSVGAFAQGPVAQVNNVPATAIYVPNNQDQTITRNTALWYRFDYGGDRSEVFVQMPNGNDMGLQFRIYTAEQVRRYDTNSSPVGRGTAPLVTCNSSKCLSPDLTWRGAFIEPGAYYIQVLNSTGLTQMFRLQVQGLSASFGPPNPVQPLLISAVQTTATPAPTIVPPTTIAPPATVPTAVPTATPITAPKPTSRAEVAATTVPVASTTAAGNQLTFATLGAKETVLRGPFDSMDLFFGLPADWQLSEGGSIELTINTSFAGSAVSTSPTQTAVGGMGTLEIAFNDVVLTTIYLDRTGERTISIPLRKEALTVVRRSGRHDFKITLDSAIDCQVDWHTAVIVRSSSSLNLPHKSVSPATDLRLLPRPLYQQMYAPENIVVVVPDQATTGELAGALSTVAGLGQMSGGKLAISLIPASKLTPEIQSASNLILVGKPSALPMLKDVVLAAPIEGAGYKVEGLKPDSGIIQIAISPWNPAKVVLLASGDSDLGVMKAGQAISSGTVKVSTSFNLAVVTDVHSDLVPNSAQVDRSLASMGYTNQIMQGYGTSEVEYRFYVPPGYTPSGEIYFDLVFNHSSLLEYDRSGLIVFLNGEPVGSVRLSDDTAKQGTYRISIPRSAIRPGANSLLLQGDMIPRSVCVDPRLATLWMTIRSESLLHIPLTATTEKDTRALDLSMFPDVLAQDPTLGTTAFIIPSQDTMAWNVAAQIASTLGNVGKPALADLAVAFSDNVPENIRNTRNWIVIGRPSTLAVVQQFNDALPAYFAPNSDLAVERSVRVVYQISPDANVGYLELVRAPWNKDRMIIGVLGTSPQGVQWAGDALSLPRLRSRLSGVYAFINGDQIVIGDSTLGPKSASVMPTVVAVQNRTAVPISQTVDDVRPGWLLPVLAAAIGLVVLILIVVLISALRKSAARRI